MEYYIFADESEKKGKLFSNFYGAVLMTDKDYQTIETELRELKKTLNLNNECKYTRITPNYLDKYKSLLEAFFVHVAANRVKVRIMFQHNQKKTSNLTKKQRDKEYFLLYYQFLKHAFGLTFMPDSDENCSVRFYLDRIPDTKAASDEFKNFIHNLTYDPKFIAKNIEIKKENIAEIDSHKHVVSQCLDIILGLTHFKLNKLDTPKSKRTKAKIKLYKFIREKICEIRPNFNFGITTGTDCKQSNRWDHPYRHWEFKSQK